MNSESRKSRAFIQIVWNYYRRHGRHHLPWRKTQNPYRILVSEMMLQQTQVDRVIPFYGAFLKQFPTPGLLAKASLARVLVAWQGLGYNRRAKMLHQAAKDIVKNGMPKTAAGLHQLPGVGPYTAAAVAAFAYNQDVVFVETNIRTAIIQQFFKRKTNISDTEILLILEKLLPKGRGREWNLALMDYGAHLKKSGVKLNPASKHYSKQSPFTGSQREARGAILHALASGPHTKAKLEKLLGAERLEQMRKARKTLMQEGLVHKHGGRFILPR